MRRDHSSELIRNPGVPPTSIGYFSTLGKNATVLHEQPPSFRITVNPTERNSRVTPYEDAFQRDRKASYQ